MISVPAGVRVLVATKPVDFRRGADSLAALAKEELDGSNNGSFLGKALLGDEVSGRGVSSFGSGVGA